ncbi:hypothetical protein CL176_02255 [Suicoccus acidiformans]|uniref:HTH cro/C1-type domain-containing protein n=1 Tax=Suicoccus acidiformans TaxID=2036206 RepID=A0A347WIN4_9LACT|nr:helix-turn-helix transcriptional regulator [Suicoccus acidiformans]AXY24941.1 hypothetical protein CL176_02255 [Suicoccus acidiformans]
MKISDRIRAALHNKGITQAELSKLTGISKSVISEWLSDKYEPKQDKIYIMAEALDVSPSWLFGISDQMESVNDITSIYEQLEPERQKRVYRYAEHELDLQKGMEDDDILIAAHHDDDLTEEEMQEINDFIKKVKEER